MQQFMGLQRVRHDLVTEQQQQSRFDLDQFTIILSYNILNIFMKRGLLGLVAKKKIYEPQNPYRVFSTHRM